MTLSVSEALALVRDYLASPLAGPLAEQGRLTNVQWRLQVELPAPGWDDLLTALGLPGPSPAESYCGYRLQGPLWGWLRSQRAARGARFEPEAADGFKELVRLGRKRHYGQGKGAA